MNRNMPDDYARARQIEQARDDLLNAIGDRDRDAQIAAHAIKLACRLASGQHRAPDVHELASLVPRHKFNGVVEDCKRLHAELAHAKRVPRLGRLASRGDYWIWQGDGSDYLDSMGNDMAVLIRAGDLRLLCSPSSRAA